MAEIKDKVVTVESLSALHEHNKNAYMSTSNPVATGTLSIEGNGNFSGDINMSSLTIGNAVFTYDDVEGAIKISFLTNEDVE